MTNENTPTLDTTNLLLAAIPGSGKSTAAYTASDTYVSTVTRDIDGRILTGPSLPCGCPLDSGCDSYHLLWKDTDPHE